MWFLFNLRVPIVVFAKSIVAKLFSVKSKDAYFALLNFVPCLTVTSFKLLLLVATTEPSLANSF